MTRDETVALFLQGREAWNAWAEKMLAERKALEDAGRWSAEEDNFGELVCHNDETLAWMEAAAADFSHCHFPLGEQSGTSASEGVRTNEQPTKSLAETQIVFSGFNFPGDVEFVGATFSGKVRFMGTTFSGEASFSNATFSAAAVMDKASFLGKVSFASAAISTASFNHATFLRDANFDATKFFHGVAFGSVIFSGAASFVSAIFSEHTSFGLVTFSGSTSFNCATFLGVAHFERATFTDIANFGSATFTGDARFKSATFTGDANFWSATFTGTANFWSATFTGTAYFGSATFQQATDFGKAIFEKNASFTGIKVERAFTMTGTTFSVLPAFNQADFKQAPDLDNVVFPLPPFWRGGDPSQIANYRAIRRMAIQGADYEREQMAFKGELRSKRWTEDKPWHPKFWLGMGYDGIADCGRSISRTFYVWGGTIFAFAAFYWLKALDGTAQRCTSADSFTHALYLSAKNALILFGGTRDVRVNQAYHCLYGTTVTTLDQPNIPASVTYVEMLLQFPISATLIFLFLLAVKNSYKIK